MIKNKGFTLVEVIVSLAILGIISIYFLGAMANHFSLLTRTKNITEQVFLVQREMEEEIDLVKQEIIDLKAGVSVPNPRDLKTKDIFVDDLGGIEVSYYEVKKSLNSKDYFTLVSNVKSEPLELIELENIGVKLLHETINVDNGYSTVDFSIVGNFKNLEEYKYDHLLNQVEWYVTNKEYNIPMPKDSNFDMDDDLDYNSYYFPLFPKDYELIANETVFKFGSSVNTFNKLEEFRGRHILYTVTPAAKSGKLGIQKVADPIFISGLPTTNNIVMHFDASYISVYDDEQVQKNDDNWFLKKWFDISSIIGNGKTSPDEFAISGSDNKPIVKRTDRDVGFIGQFLSFYNDDDSEEFLEINQETENKTLTAISVVKNRSKDEETEYLKNGEIELKLEQNSDEGEHTWIVHFEVFESRDNQFLIGGEYVDIAEIIVYEGELNETTLNEIENYLIEKYKSPIVMWE